MDRLRQDEIEEIRRLSPSEKGKQALDLMRTGIHLKQAALRARHPSASEEEIEALLQAWLDEDG